MRRVYCPLFLKTAGIVGASLYPLLNISVMTLLESGISSFMSPVHASGIVIDGSTNLFTGTTIYATSNPFTISFSAAGAFTRDVRSSVSAAVIHISNSAVYNVTLSNRYLGSGNTGSIMNLLLTGASSITLSSLFSISGATYPLSPGSARVGATAGATLYVPATFGSSILLNTSSLNIYTDSAVTNPTNSTMSLIVWGYSSISSSITNDPNTFTMNGNIQGSGSNSILELSGGNVRFAGNGSLDRLRVTGSSIIRLAANPYKNTSNPGLEFCSSATFYPEAVVEGSIGISNSTTVTISASSGVYGTIDDVISSIPAATAVISLWKAGSGSVSLRGLNTYTGSFTISNGTLMMGSTQAFGVSTANSVSFQGTSTLSVSPSFSDYAGNVSASFSLITDSNGVSRATINVPSLGQILNISGSLSSISTSDVLQKTGSGTLMFLGHGSTISGAVQINQGVVGMRYTDSLSTTTGTILFNNAIAGDYPVLKLGTGGASVAISISTSIAVPAGTTCRVWIDSANSTAVTCGSAITGTGTLQQVGTTALTFNNYNFTGTYTILNGSAQLTLSPGNGISFSS